MTSYNFHSEYFWSNQIVYVDTATLMNVGAMKKFISNYGDEIRRSGRKIKVPLSVRHELSRHFQRRSSPKSVAAMEAEILLGDHSDLFDLQGENWLDKKELSEAFADPDLLATLTLHKMKENQTLITNDRTLGENASDINKWQSCSGYAITICYVNRNGELCKCEPWGTEQVSSIETVFPDADNLGVEAEPEGVVLEKAETKPAGIVQEESRAEPKGKRARAKVEVDIKGMVFSAIGFVTGMITAYYAKDAVSSTKRVCRALAQVF